MEMEIIPIRYEIVEPIGVGATSRVDKAHDTIIGRTVAIKTFLQSFSSDDLQQQFVSEAQIIGRLSHPNIVGLYDVGTNSDGLPYLVMEYVEGQTLEAILDSGAVPIGRAAQWAGDLASALAVAHQAKIIHGDVKPANILVTSEGKVKLGDFGVARFATQTSSGRIMGTPAYLSPEQIQGHWQDTRSDLFSLGIVLYQMACGVRPFDGSSIGAVCAQIVSQDPPLPSRHNAAVPPELDRVIMRCLAKQPTDRYSNADKLASAIYPFARKSSAENAEPVREPALQEPAPSKKPSRRSPRPNPFAGLGRSIPPKVKWLSAAAFALVLVTAGAIYAVRNHSLFPASTNSQTSSPVSDSSRSADASSTASTLERDVLSGPNLLEKYPPPHAVSKKSASGRAHQPAVSNSESEKNIAGENAAPPPPAEKPLAAAPAAPRKGTLSVQVLSSVANETLEVYAGSDLVLSTPLQASHIGEALHFDCPLSIGSHPLRVVLLKANSKPHAQKEGTAEIVADGHNKMEIRISRRSKLLIGKETALEITWPNTLSADARQKATSAAIDTKD
jgi:serine/threonine protein kinase